MGVAVSIFEPHPKNFKNKHNFWRCLNDISIFFWYLYWFQIFQNCQKLGTPVCRFSMVRVKGEILDFSWGSNQEWGCIQVDTVVV